MQRLEPRVLLSAAPIGPEFQVNTTTANSQFTNTTGQGGSMAMDADELVAGRADRQGHR
jgi:hypothetical protein